METHAYWQLSRGFLEQCQTRYTLLGIEITPRSDTACTSSVQKKSTHSQKYSALSVQMLLTWSFSFGSLSKTSIEATVVRGNLPRRNRSDTCLNKILNSAIKWNITAQYHGCEFVLKCDSSVPIRGNEHAQNGEVCILDSSEHNGSIIIIATRLSQSKLPTQKRIPKLLATHCTD